MYRPLPTESVLRIFLETWSQYTALLEVDVHEPDVLNFILDVEAQIRRLYPDLTLFNQVHSRLMDDPNCRSLRATRAALGELFLLFEMWPCRNYFSNGK